MLILCFTTAVLLVALPRSTRSEIEKRELAAWDDDLFAEWAPPEGAYQVNLGGDLYIIKVTTQVENGRKLVVVKDS